MLVYHRYTNANIGPCVVVTQLNHPTYHQASIKILCRYSWKATEWYSLIFTITVNRHLLQLSAKLSRSYVRSSLVSDQKLSWAFYLDRSVEKAIGFSPLSKRIAFRDFIVCKGDYIWWGWKLHEDIPINLLSTFQLITFIPHQRERWCCYNEVGGGVHKQTSHPLLERTLNPFAVTKRMVINDA